MDNSHSPLRFNGEAYLHKVFRMDGYLNIVLCTTHLLPNSAKNTESIWIECHVSDPKLQETFIYWGTRVKRGYGVKLRFSVQYLGICGLQSGLTDADPSQIITMKAQVDTLPEFYHTDPHANNGV